MDALHKTKGQPHSVDQISEAGVAPAEPVKGESSTELCSLTDDGSIDKKGVADEHAAVGGETEKNQSATVDKEDEDGKPEEVDQSGTTEKNDDQANIAIGTVDVNAEDACQVEDAENADNAENSAENKDSALDSIAEGVVDVQKDTKEDEDVVKEGENEQADVDEVVEKIKQDRNLSPHEQGALGCIVDAGKPTPLLRIQLLNVAHSIPANYVPPGASSVPHHRLRTDHRLAAASVPRGVPARHSEGAPDDRVSPLWAARYRENSDRPRARKRGWLSHARSHSVRRTEQGVCSSTRRPFPPANFLFKWYGESEKVVRAIFSLARRLSPCIIFIDEIDSLFRARTSDSGEVHRDVLVEFMQEMDGLKSSRKDNVVVIGATNRPFDLDDAILRRLPRRLLVDLPGEKEREGTPACFAIFRG